MVAKAIPSGMFQFCLRELLTLDVDSAESYSPDDHRFDLRPFLYPPAFESWSFMKIDQPVEALEKRRRERDEAKHAS